MMLREIINTQKAQYRHRHSRTGPVVMIMIIAISSSSNGKEVENMPGLWGLHETYLLSHLRSVNTHNVYCGPDSEYGTVNPGRNKPCYLEDTQWRL